MGSAALFLLVSGIVSCQAFLPNPGRMHLGWGGGQVNRVQHYSVSLEKCAASPLASFATNPGWNSRADPRGVFQSSMGRRADGRPGDGAQYEWGLGIGAALQPLTSNRRQRGQSCSMWRVPSSRQTAGGGIVRAGSGDSESEVPANTRDDLHLERKLFHIMGGYAFAVARLNTPQALFVTVVGAMGVATIFFEVLRIRYKFWNKIFFAVLGRVMRKHEADHFSGMAYYMLGVTVTCALFHETLSVIGILALTIGDPAASLVGQTTRRVLKEGSVASSLMSKKIVFGKSVAGTLGFFVSAAALIFAALSCGSGTLTGPLVFAIVLVPAAVGAIVELAIPSPQLCLPLRYFPLGIDDNLVLPVIASFASWLAWTALGGPQLPVMRPLIFL